MLFFTGLVLLTSRVMHVVVVSFSKQKTLERNLMNINVTLSHCRQMPVFVFGSNPNLRQCGARLHNTVTHLEICGSTR